MMLIIIDDDRNVQPTKNDNSDAGGSVYYYATACGAADGEAKLISTYSLQTIIDHAGLLLRLRGAGVHRSTTVLAVVRSTRI